MIKFGIVILNYKNYKDTINCIEDFLSQKSDNIDIKISVVDNASPNESYEILNNKYCNSSNIIVSKTKENLGFANGNNFGLEQLNNINYDYDFVICSNDDIRLNNSNIYDWIINEYNQNKFALLGPDIYSIKNNFHQSPMSNLPVEINKINLILFKQHTKSILLHLLPLSFYLKLFGKNSCIDSNKWDEYQENITLQGAFIVYSKNYFEKYNTLFDKGTFLYAEEHILKVRCNKHNLKIVYSPNFSVNHLQGVATNLINKSEKKKKIIRLKHEIKSTKRYKKVLKEGV